MPSRGNFVELPGLSETEIILGMALSYPCLTRVRKNHLYRHIQPWIAHHTYMGNGNFEYAGT